MKIGIEAQRLFREKKHGIELVAVELIKNLQVLDKENEYFLFIKPDKDNKCIHQTENFRIVEINAPTYPVWEQLALPLIASKYGCHILHCTSNTAPLFAKTPFVVTLHDIIYLEKSYPGIIKSKGTYYQKYGNIYRRFIVPRIVKSARRVITVSNAEKHRIINHFGFDSIDQKIRVVYNAAGEQFKPIENVNQLNEIKLRFSLPDRFVLFLGNTDEKKNTLGVLKAYAIFLEKSDEKIPLVISDYKSSDLKNSLNSIGKPEIAGNIQLIGYVPNHYMPMLYNLCSIFLYPSLRESFGIPVLEAMKCGKPVITSNTSSMPEVSGGNAIMVDPENPEEIAEGLIRLSVDKMLVENLVQKGFQQAEKFSWMKMAENVLEVYKQFEPAK